MIYLDHGATSFPKPPQVHRAMLQALATCANPGRGGHAAAVEAAKQVYLCREEVARMFDCKPEQVVFTGNCTHGLNIAIRTLVKPGDRVVISGFEHNAVTRPLYGLGAIADVAGKRLFDWENTLTEWEKAVKKRPKAAIFTHVSNVFGYILPVEEMATLCRHYGIPFVIDAAQSAGMLPISMKELGADFIAMPGHKGLLGPQGTGILLCGRMPDPLLYGGTGSASVEQSMPSFLPDVAEAGTVNVPGIAGLYAGIDYVNRMGIQKILSTEQTQAHRCAEGLREMGLRVYAGPHQSGTVSFLPAEDCEEVAQKLADRGIAVRAGLHCAPLAHKTAVTLSTGTLRVSFGHHATRAQTDAFLQAIRGLL